MQSSTLIVTAAFHEPWQSRFEELRRVHYPAAINRVPAHVSLFHKLPADILGDLVEAIGGLAATVSPLARADGVRNLGRGVALRIAAPGLSRMRSELAGLHAALLTPQDRQPYEPHLTVQNKVEPSVAAELAASLRTTIWPEPLLLATVKIWHYQSDGTWLPAADIDWPEPASR